MRDDEGRGEEGEEVRVGVCMQGADDCVMRKDLARKQAKKPGRSEHAGMSIRGCGDCAARKDMAAKKAKKVGLE